jgi:predicted amidophosphoribosyltransferase
MLPRLADRLAVGSAIRRARPPSGSMGTPRCTRRRCCSWRGIYCSSRGSRRQMRWIGAGAFALSGLVGAASARRLHALRDRGQLRALRRETRSQPMAQPRHDRRGRGDLAAPCRPRPGASAPEGWRRGRGTRRACHGRHGPACLRSASPARDSICSRRGGALCAERLREAALCGTCLAGERIVRQLLCDASGPYLVPREGAGGAAPLVHAFKPGADAVALAMAAARAGAALPADRAWDALVPMPAHRIRVRERGWEPVAELDTRARRAHGPAGRARVRRSRHTPRLTGRGAGSAASHKGHSRRRRERIAAVGRR